MNKKTIRLTENDLHRIITESVSKILSEYTNGYTEDLFTAMNDLGTDSPATSARKRAARDYLSDRWKRENNLSDRQVDAVNNRDATSLYNAKLPGTFLRRLDQTTKNGNKAENAACRMSANLRKRRPLPTAQPSQPSQPVKKGGFFNFK